MFLGSYLIVNNHSFLVVIMIAIFLVVVFLVLLRTLLIESGTIKPHIKHKHNKIKKKTVSKRFQEIYNYIESEYAKDLESNRKKLIKYMIICAVLFIISCLLFLFLVTNLRIHTRLGYKLIGFICIPIIMVGVHSYLKYNKIYKENFKDKIIKNLFKYINPNLQYDPIGGNNLHKYYLDAGFKGDFNKFITDDYIEGCHENNINLKMANIALGDNDKTKFLYEGIFSVTEINQYLQDKVIIKKNKYMFKDNDYKKIGMDSEEFEKYFDVYSTSSMLAMEILTHDIMEELVEFYNTYRIEFEIVFKDNHIYIRFDTGVMFEPNILKKSNDLSTLWVYYNVMNFAISLTMRINNVLQEIDI